MAKTWMKMVMAMVVPGGDGSGGRSIQGSGIADDNEGNAYGCAVVAIMLMVSAMRI